MKEVLTVLFVGFAVSMVTCKLGFFYFLRANGLSPNPMNQKRFLSVADVVHFYSESTAVSEQQKKILRKFEIWETCNLAFFPVMLLLVCLVVVFF